MLVGDAVRHRGRQPFEQRGVLLERALVHRIATAVGPGREPDHTVADREAGDARADGDDLPRDVRAEHGGCPEPAVGDRAGALDHPVDRVDGDGAHAHHHFVGGGVGHGDPVDDERSPGFAEDGCGVVGHDGPLGSR